MVTATVGLQMTTEQLAFDFAAVASRLRDQLKRTDRDRRLDGPTRLLLGLLRTVDLREDALPRAAALCLELDLELLAENGHATEARDRALAAALAGERNGNGRAAA